MRCAAMRLDYYFFAEIGQSKFYLKRSKVLKNGTLTNNLVLISIFATHFIQA